MHSVGFMENNLAYIKNENVVVYNMEVKEYLEKKQDDVNYEDILLAFSDLKLLQMGVDYKELDDKYMILHGVALLSSEKISDNLEYILDKIMSLIIKYT